MVMPARSSSSGMQSIRRELQRRRSKLPKSSIAKKPSAPPPDPPRQEHPSFAASKSPPASAVTTAPRPSRPRPHPAPRPAAVSPATPPPPCSDKRLLKPWTAVGVRTRTTKLKNGKVLILWLRATVVSATHEGYEVFYDGNFPAGDPNDTIHVPIRHVRMIKPSPSPMTPPPHQTPSSRGPRSSASDTTVMAKKAPRPTTAGKSIRLVRSLFPEIERQARAALPSY